jgi:hypothetical protein
MYPFSIALPFCATAFEKYDMRAACMLLALLPLLKLGIGELRTYTEARFVSLTKDARA